MNLFTYEEQGGKRYLVYEKRAEDDMDFLTLEMISNNTIDGAAASAYIQVDDKFLVKYDITKLKSFREYLQGTVSRQKFLSILESIANAVMEAEEYMLSLSSYVMDEDYIYIDPVTMKVFMIVLPIKREEVSPETFLKQLLMDVQYDQSEDCSYVVTLLNMFKGVETFSIAMFKEQILQLKKEIIKIKKAEADPEEKPERKLPEPEKKSAISEEEREKIVHELRRQHDLDVLFAVEEEEMFSQSEKVGFFSRKDKANKKKTEKKEAVEKKGFWKKIFMKDKDTSDSIPSAMPDMGGISIPGMDIPGRIPKETGYNEKINIEQNIAIPVQNIELERKNVEIQDFGETEFITKEDEEETQFISMDSKEAQPEFILCRCSTGERFRIKDDITRVGRSSSIAEICISGNPRIGRVHALLYIREGQVFIADNNSKNGTYLDEILLKQEESPRCLTDGSRIRLGDEELEFYIQG